MEDAYEESFLGESEEAVFDDPLRCEDFKLQVLDRPEVLRIGCGQNEVILGGGCRNYGITGPEPA